MDAMTDEGRDFISDELLLSNDVDKLSPDTPINPKHAAKLLGVNTGTLRDWRRDGKPPPFQQRVARGSVRYPLGGVLAARKSHVYKSTAASRVAHKAERAGFSNFAAFCAGAALNDEWLFDVIDGGKPVDFFAALGTESADNEADENDEDCRWLTLREYLDMRLEWGKREVARLEGVRIGIAIPEPAPIETLCSYGCGRAAHPGRRCRL
jgi:hypothetical protein